METTIIDDQFDRHRKVGHGHEAFFYSLSKMLERGSYYGMKAILVLYLLDNTINMSKPNAMILYGALSGSLLFSGIIGGVLGDLLIGNKKSVLAGALLQALGCFSLCVSSQPFLYIGLSLIVIGGGLYSPNLSANFGKCYLRKIKLMDAGFSLLYMAINLGVLLGMIIIGYVAELFTFQSGFLVAGVMMIVSILPVINIPEEELNLSTAPPVKSDFRILNIIVGIFLVAVFWSIYELAGDRIFEVQHRLSEIIGLNVPHTLWTSLNPIVLIPCGIIAFFYWSNNYSSSFLKLSIGFVLAAGSIFILMLIPQGFGSNYLFYFLIMEFLLGVAEIFIGPMMLSIVTQYSNPKYLAIMMSLSALPIKTFSYIFGMIGLFIGDDLPTGLMVCLGMMLLMGLIAYALHTINPRPKLDQ